MPRSLLSLLPLELWDAILAQVDDPIDLWRTRSVCHQLSHSARRAFARRFLPLLEIEILARTPRASSIVLTFDRLCSTGGADNSFSGVHADTAALFTCIKNDRWTDAAHLSAESSVPPKRDSGLDVSVSANASGAVAFAPHAKPVHYLRLPLGPTTLINDTPLPGLRIHAFSPATGTASVSIDWVAAMDAFFRDEVFLRQYRLKFVSSDRITQVYFCARQVPGGALVGASPIPPVPLADLLPSPVARARADRYKSSAAAPPGCLSRPRASSGRRRGCRPCCPC